MTDARKNAVGAEAAFPAWAQDILACPSCRQQIMMSGSIATCAACGPRGEWRDGILCFNIPEDDPSIAWYARKGGAQFEERSRLPFTMSSLDTPVYHAYLDAIRPADSERLIVDVGAGDGRNAEYLLERGCRRLIAIDVNIDSLTRFRSRMQSDHPGSLERLLLIQADARALPLLAAKAEMVLAIETLYFLNEAYEAGFAECCRVLAPAGRVLLSERAWEGALITRALYGGTAELPGNSAERYLNDGPSDDPVRTRTFSRDELARIIEKAGLEQLETGGMPLLSAVIGYLREQGKLTTGDERGFPAVVALLRSLRESGAACRTHMVLARKKTS